MGKNKKRFDAVAMMRQIRDRMSREIEGMSYEEQKRYLSDRFQIKKKQEQVAEPKKAV